MSSEHQPQEEMAGAPDGDGDSAPAQASEREEEVKPEQDRIAEITERIDKARSHAEDAGVLVDTDEEHFADSGVTETDDDQTIAPPG